MNTFIDSININTNFSYSIEEDFTIIGNSTIYVKIDFSEYLIEDFLNEFFKLDFQQAIEENFLESYGYLLKTVSVKKISERTLMYTLQSDDIIKPLIEEEEDFFPEMILENLLEDIMERILE